MYNNKQANNYRGWRREMAKDETYQIVLKVDAGTLLTLNTDPGIRLSGRLVSLSKGTVYPGQRVEVVLVTQS